jgi:hypothetical protein
LKMRSCWDGGRQAANLRTPSQSVRNPTTEFQLGVIRDAGPEITSGLGAFLYAARFKPGFGRAFGEEPHSFVKGPLQEGRAPDPSCRATVARWAAETQNMRVGFVSSA